MLLTDWWCRLLILAFFALAIYTAVSIAVEVTVKCGADLVAFLRSIK